jgi:hypothetical protein
MATARSEATQKFVPVEEVRNGIIVLKDGSYRGVLMCSSTNLALKAANEQHAIISGFQDFLNTLDFSIQVIVHSRKMDIRPYIALLEGKAAEQKTELLKIQLREYVEFIRSFGEKQNIMTKTFYIVVPYSGGSLPQVGKAIGIFSGAKSKAETTDQSFEEQAAQLEQRLALVAGGLGGTGIRAVRLGTEEVIELLYRAFNPGELENPIRLDK